MLNAAARNTGMVNQYRGTQYIEDIPEVKVEFIAEDDEAEQIASTIVTTLRTGALCDGEITILPMEKIVCVRVGKL
jgi:nitrogen regulatory protein PII